MHHIGGHTKGLQAVRVMTATGPVVLASDASHFYAHYEQQRVFPVLYNLADVIEGYRKLSRLAGPAQCIIPGHDPLVLDRYAAPGAATEDWVARIEPGDGPLGG